VPFNVTLKRFGDPESVDVPVNVAVPADALSVPPTDRSDFIEKLFVVETDPETFKALNVIVPAPPMVFEAPLIVRVPPFPVKVPPTEILPATVKEVVVLTDPETVKLSNEMPEPVIVLPPPLIVTVPAPPVRCVNVPAPLDNRFPKTVRFVAAAAVIPAPVIVRLLKLLAPPPLRLLPEPPNVTVLVLPVKVPSLVQFPNTVCAKDPPLKVVDVPMDTFPFTVIAAAAV
jgi:hypothetical protein